jgi:hypothetical protein
MKRAAIYLFLLKTLTCYKSNDYYIDDSYANDLESVYDDGEEEISVIIYDLIEQLQDPDDGSPFGMALRTTDVDCIEKEYAKYELTDLLPEIRYLLMESSFDEVRSFMSVVTMCSSRVIDILGMKFDHFLSQNGPATMIINDRHFEEFLVNLRCFKEYSINHRLLTVTMNYTTADKPEKSCQEIITKFRENFSIKHSNSERTRCLEEVHTFDDSTLKYLLMIQLHLTNEDLAVERKQFIVDAHKNHKKLLSCIKAKR